MLESKARFIPIFCDVEPSDLRYPDEGVYAPAFAKHKQVESSKLRIRQWKTALRSSSFISGYQFTTTNDNVERLCTKITLAVQQEVGKLNVFPTRGDQIGLHAASTSRPVEVKKSSLLPRDSHPVGLQSKLEDINRLLQNPEIQVIAVVGMGGSGKTFLLQNVYKAVKFKYDHSIWLSISKFYSLKNLQYDIASHIGLRSEIVDAQITEERAAELIQEHLEGKRCLIVLDDLWTLSTENSLIDKLGLPADNDCKVVVTTRNRQVARNSGARIYEMKNLSDEDSWRLLCIYAFPHSGGHRAPQQIEEEGRKIVKQCGNLPLAIKTIGASLANTLLLRKWESKRCQLERVVTPMGAELDHVMKILKLSYDSLPAHLKQCFAYLSFFPEDAEIDAEYLINLWIGEGFVPAGEGQWDMAWDWLDQLAQLCLLQVYEGDMEFNILIKYSKIHDLLHDLAIHISKQDKCVFSVEEISTLDTSGATGWHRILLANKGLHEFSMSENRPVYLRTLSFYANFEMTSIQENLFTTMRGLRVLDLSHTSISTLPASLGKMILLRVLNLKYTEVMEVPECVRNFKNLLFLALARHCRSLPVWISELICLQHLEAWNIDRMPRGISELASLRTLRSYYLDLSIEEDEFMRLDDLVKMTQLWEVKLRIWHEMELKRMEQGILAQLLNVRHLDILNNGKRLLLFSDKMRAMKYLERLTLESFIVPSWIHELANLRRLILIHCEHTDFPELQAMPNLVVLDIQSNDTCREIPKAFGKSGGFPQLRFLTIAGFSSLEQFPELQEGAMACLQNFNIWECPRLKKVEGLERLKRLQRFYLGIEADDEWENEWWRSLQEGREYWNQIEATNPHVRIEIHNSKYSVN